MAEEVANTVAGKILDLLFSGAKREIDYIRNYTKNADILKNEAQKLKDMSDRIQQRINAAKENGEALLAGVQNWMDKADIEISKVEEFLEEEANAKKTCFNLRPCVNLSTLHHYSKMSINKTLFLLQHQEDGQTYESCVSIPTPTPRLVDLYQTKNLDDIDTHKLALRKIIEAIKDESIKMVGIYGSGGVGKTTLAKEVAAEVKNLFAEIVFITVSQTVDVKEIQKNVEKAAKRIIINKEKVLIILDDIWKKLVLSDVGIPCGNEHMNCKILLTSRRRNVCEHMNTDRNICVNTLTKKEAWFLFKRIVGDEKLANDSGLEKIAKEVTEECGGLPLIIQAVGNALKNKKIDIWEAALDRLRKHAPLELDPEISSAFTHLKLSYDLLDSKEAKSCFLLCSLFKEDGVISLLSLAEYGVGIGIFKDLDSINDAEKRVRMAVDTLTSSSLLLSEGDEVKMHDVVRDVALLITSSSEGEEKEKFLVEAGNKDITEWQPRNRTSESYTKISLMDNRIHKLPDHELHFPLLDTFLIQNNRLSIIPDDFFGGMKEVKVLDMSWNKITSLPQSLKLLTKLITLDISYNKNLIEICIVGELKDLEILKVRGTGIKVIPEEIGQLTNLRLLDAEGCPYLSHVAPGVISKLTWLEELYFGTDDKNAVSRLGLMEISKLKSFRALHLSMHSDDCHLFPEGTCFEKLKEFYFQFWKGRRFLFEIESKSYLKRRLHISDSNFPFKMPIKKLFQVSDGIILTEIAGLDNIIPDLYGESTIDELKFIRMISCENASCLVKITDEDEDATQTFVASNDLMLGQRKTTKEKYFSQVEQIRLTDLKNLKLLFDCSFQYISLRNLQAIEVARCTSLSVLFPLSVAQGLSNLRKIRIRRCTSLMVVISGGDEQTTDNDIEFPRLTRIELGFLPQLKSFYSGDSTVKYPSLEFIKVENCPSMKRWGSGVHVMSNVKFGDDQEILNLFHKN
ncbi:disease resistance protein At4g27190 [Lactuca sativa]|uniref:disease resistance protein At4g27190 n=1 Tax=Lactuca sativa TaxID=4236 RepID=UPI000CBF75F6|nr:disease resistance protein At4g27190 [Lactuca sativa]